MNIFKRKSKPYVNPSIYVTAREMREWLENVPDESLIRVPATTGGTNLVKEMYYHEQTGIFLS